jgi:hypothetical protein
VSLGGYHGACVTAGGDVVTWGRGHHGQLGNGAAGPQLVPRRVAGLPPAAQVACPPPSRTKWTRLVHPSVLIGHVSSL